MRPIWSGSISFFLVNIPVRLYSATESATLNFDLLHKKDLSRIRYQRICEEEQKAVPYEELIRGYEYRKNFYVVLTSDDFKSADPKKTYSIDILAFVNLSEIDPVFFEKPYYLEPDRGADHSYVLLKESLFKTKKVAVAKFILRDREHLLLIRPYQDLLILNVLRYASQIRSPEKLEIKQKIEEVELEMAISLVDKLTKKFIPENYKDDYLEKLKKVIDKKVAGQAIEVKTFAPQATKVDDLMKKLQESIRESEKMAKTK